MIGILTFHHGPNYGGFLQAWHMREAVRALGHEATLINYQTPLHYQAESLRLPPLGLKPLKGFVLQWLKSRPFSGPVSELSDHPFTTNPEKINWDRFSTIIVGADIVWDFTNKLFGFDPTFYGSLPCQGGSRFTAYAPSCGATKADSPIPEHVKIGLERFDSISVRDEATAMITERVTGQSPPLVVDPTWLQDDPDVANPKRPKHPYALVYGHGVTPPRARALKRYCKEQGLKLITCTFPCSTADKKVLSIGPFEWVDLFRHASCVITSTFHGLLYALKYRKPLIFMPNPASQSKSKLVVERLHLEQSVIEEDTPFDEASIKRALGSREPTGPPQQWVEASRAILAGYLPKAD